MSPIFVSEEKYFNYNLKKNFEKKILVHLFIYLIVCPHAFWGIYIYWISSNGRKMLRDNIIQHLFSEC